MSIAAAVLLDHCEVRARWPRTARDRIVGGEDHGPNGRLDRRRLGRSRTEGGRFWIRRSRQESFDGGGGIQSGILHPGFTDMGSGRQVRPIAERFWLAARANGGNDAELFDLDALVDVPDLEDWHRDSTLLLTVPGHVHRRRGCHDDPATFAFCRMKSDLMDLPRPDGPAPQQQTEPQIPKRERSSRRAGDDPETFPVKTKGRDRAKVARLRQVVDRPHRAHIEYQDRGESGTENEVHGRVCGRKWSASHYTAKSAREANVPVLKLARAVA